MNLIEEYKLQDPTIVIDDSYENSKLIIQNMLVICKDGQYGVVDTKFKPIIGNKYKPIGLFVIPKLYICSVVMWLYGNVVA